MASNETSTVAMRRAVLLSTVSSLCIPVLGLLSQPILARGLGVEGRGVLAAALAPSALVAAVATLGLPEALTYLLAKRPELVRKALVSAGFLMVLVAALCVGLVWVVAPLLSSNDQQLGSWMVLGTAFSAPALVLSSLRGAASGLQEWGLVSLERVLGAILRIAALSVLFFQGNLTVLGALLVTLIAPIVGGLLYSTMFFGAKARRDQIDEIEPSFSARKDLLSFGSRVWLGAVAEMFLGRVGQLLVSPLSSNEQLGLYAVASTVADIPIIAALAVQSAVFGVSSRLMNFEAVSRASRVAWSIALFGCLVLTASMPLWLAFLFGAEFQDAQVPTAIMLLSAAVCVPGLLAASGISALGRPGLRSAGLGGTLIVYMATILVLVPMLGALGAAFTSLIANVVMTSYMLTMFKRLSGVPKRRLVIPDKADWNYFKTAFLASWRRISVRS